jgi:hypothetical protein
MIVSLLQNSSNPSNLFYFDQIPAVKVLLKAFEVAEQAIVGRKVSSVANLEQVLLEMTG